MLVRKIAVLVSLFAAALTAVGCGSPDAIGPTGPTGPTGSAGSAGTAGAAGAANTSGTEPSQGQTIQFGSFIGGVSGGGSALQAILRVHLSRHPEDRVTYADIFYLDVPGDIAKRIVAGNPPDVFTQHATQMGAFLETNGPGSLYPLNDFLALPSEADILPNMYPEYVADATIDGKIFGVPQTVNCMNVFVYNKAVFAAHQLNPPTTIDEFRTVCQTLKAAGVAPFAVFGLTYLLQDLAAAVMGIDAFSSFMKGGTPDETRLSDTIDLFAEVMDNYFDPNLSGFVNAIPAFMNGAAMYISGDWAEGSLVELGWTPGVDFSTNFAPGTQGLFTYALDVISVLGSTPNLRGALNFVDTVASLEGQTEYQKFGRQVPPRTDVDPNLFSSERRVVIEGMRQAKRRLPVNPSLIWESAIGVFLNSTPHDKEFLRQAMLTVR